jgi:hypothetical protein
MQRELMPATALRWQWRRSRGFVIHQGDETAPDKGEEAGQQAEVAACRAAGERPFPAAFSDCSPVDASMGTIMSLTVDNTHPDDPVVTLFGQLIDGSYVAKKMHEDAVPYTRYWKNALDQVMVYVVPDDAQLDAIVQALNAGKLDYSTLQDYGSAGGGTSTFPI